MNPRKQRLACSATAAAAAAVASMQLLLRELLAFPR